MTLTRLAKALVLALTTGCGGSGGGPMPPLDEHCYPNMSEPEPKGTVPLGTVTLRMTTDRNVYCRYSQVEGLLYVEMENAFAQTGGRVHTTPVTGLAPGAHRMFAKCGDVVDRQTECSTPHDLIFLFSIAESGGS